MYTGKGTSLIDFFCLFLIEVLNSTSCHCKTYCKVMSSIIHLCTWVVWQIWWWTRHTWWCSKIRRTTWLRESEEVELVDNKLSFWPLPSVNESSCRIKCVHKNKYITIIIISIICSNLAVAVQRGNAASELGSLSLWLHFCLLVCLFVCLT